MRRKLFLTGASGCGKSTLIRRRLGGALSLAGGFVTERALSNDGSTAGYDLYPAAHAAGVAGFEGARFLDYTVTPPTHDNEVFRREGVQLLEEAAYYPFALIDEFGGYEILVPQFCAALVRLIRSDVPCIGVLKGFENAQELKQRFGLGDRYTQKLRALYDMLRADPDVLIVEMSGSGDENAAEKVQSWAAEYAR